MSLYKHIFLDLDRTLRDMDGNSHQTLCELAVTHKLEERGIGPLEEFICRYKVINDQLWLDYSKDLVDRETLRIDRFRRSFALYGIRDEEFSVAFASDYVKHAPLKN